MTAGLTAGVIKKTRSEITFKGFGKFGLIGEEKISADKSFSRRQSDFKGQGIGGDLAERVLKKKSKEGEEKEPAMIYYFELLSLNLASLTEADFQLPAGYKKKG